MTEKNIPHPNLKPTPDDFCRFVPWACQQFELVQHVVITKTPQASFTSSIRNKKKTVVSDSSDENLSAPSIKHHDGAKLSMHSISEPHVVHIMTSYEGNHLVKLKISRAHKIPVILLKVIGITLPFQKQLASIVIDKNVKAETVYEISNLLPMSHITEVILDGNNLSQYNCSILLAKGALKHLSLSKCSIDDKTVQEIAQNLTYPNTAAKSLCLLNLGINKITDVGAKYLGQALRSNRQLKYLNLVNNAIYDEGAISILNSLKEFQLEQEEIVKYGERLCVYMKEKMKEIENENLHVNFELESKNSKKSNKSTRTGRSIAIDVETQKKMSDFGDPFSRTHTNIIDGKTYCVGNNSICYLNFSYNNLTYLSVKVILDVLIYQRDLDRKPKGLLKIGIDGNLIPDDCDEYRKIDDIIIGMTDRQYGAKKRMIATPRS